MNEPITLIIQRIQRDNHKRFQERPKRGEVVEYILWHVAAGQPVPLA